jgi:hypothetical protein
MSRLGKDGAEADAVWQRLGEPQQRFSTLLVVYPTDPNGDIPADDAAKRRILTDWQIKPWKFGKQTYDEIWKLNEGLKENGLGIHLQDVKLECKDAKYQNIKVSFVGKAIWRMKDAVRESVLVAALAQYDKLIPYREVTTDWLRSKLGLAGPLAGSDSGTEVSTGRDFGDLLDQI